MEKILTAFSNQFSMVAKNPNATRSTAITLELHSEIHSIVEALVGSGYQVFSQKNKEASVQGAFLSKKADIAIFKNGKAVGVIEVKAIRSSYKKNATNYFYNMLGETANLQTAGIPVCQVILIPSIVKTVNAGVASQEVIGDSQLEKYRTLENSENNFSKPKRMIVSVVDVDYDSENFECKFSKLDGFNDELKEFLTQSGSNVITSIEDFVRTEVLVQKK